MMQNIPLDEHFPASVIRDLRAVVAQHRAAGHQVRVVRVYALDLAPIIDRVVEGQYLPFQPTILGLPVVPWEREEIGVFAIADDDTPLSVRHDGRVEERI